MEGGCMLDKCKAWLIVKCWYIRYYMTHPSMYWKMLKLRKDKE